MGGALRLAHVAFALGLLLSGPAHGLQPDEMMTDPALEARARAISSGLRCVVCQNQSIDDSDASLARDLRLLVRERLKAGDDDTAVRDFVAQRYGEFVLLKPVWALHTALLWIGPLLVLLAAIAGLVLSRRNRTLAADTPLSADEALRIHAIEAEAGRDVTPR